MHRVPVPFRSLFLGGGLFLMTSATLVYSPAADAQSLQPLAQLESLHLDTSKVGRVTAYFEPTDRIRAEELATLSENASAFFERELGIEFELGVAALSPEHWFSEFPNIPYAIPWPSMPDKLIFMPSSLREGLLIQGPTELADRRRVDFVLLHEYGHIAAKAYFRPADDRDYLTVKWFEELLATYFAYAFVRASDSAWATAARDAWRSEVQRYTPAELSLDWSFMNDLPGDELARTYAWYQFMLNLRAAEIYDQHGIRFLEMLQEQLPWLEADDWNTAVVLPLLEEIAPGFEAWEASLPGMGGKRHDDH